MDLLTWYVSTKKPDTRLNFHSRVLTFCVEHSKSKGKIRPFLWRKLIFCYDATTVEFCLISVDREILLSFIIYFQDVRYVCIIQRKGEKPGC